MVSFLLPSPSFHPSLLQLIPLLSFLSVIYSWKFLDMQFPACSLFTLSLILRSRSNILCFPLHAESTPIHPQPSQVRGRALWSIWFPKSPATRLWPPHPNLCIFLKDVIAQYAHGFISLQRCLLLGPGQGHLVPTWFASFKSKQFEILWTCPHDCGCASSLSQSIPVDPSTDPPYLIQVVAFSLIGNWIRSESSISVLFCFCKSVSR